jgi:hypothetical protein
MPALATDFPLTIVPGMTEYNKLFHEADEAAQAPNFDPIFAITTTDKLTDVEVAMGDLARVPQRAGPTADIEELGFEEEFKVQVNVTEYAARFLIPKVQWKALPGELRARYPRAFANSARTTLEHIAWELIAGVFADDGPDGEKVCDTDHPSDAGNWSNKGTTAFSAAALSASFAAIMRIPTPRGRIVQAQMPKYLVGPPDLSKTIFETLNASSVTTEFRDANIASSYGLTAILPPQLTNAKDWMLMLDPMVTPHVRMVMQTVPDFQSGYSAENARYWGLTDFAVGVGFYTSRGIFGQDVA